MQTYWGTILEQIRYLKGDEENEKMEKVLAQIEHLFRNYKYCDEQLCYIQQVHKKGKPYFPEESKSLFIKSEERKMYQ